MEISEKLTKIVNGYMRMQYGIALSQLATTTKIVNERRKSSHAESDNKISLFAYSNSIGQGELDTLRESGKNYDVLSDTKPNPPIA